MNMKYMTLGLLLAGMAVPAMARTRSKSAKESRPAATKMTRGMQDFSMPQSHDNFVIKVKNESGKALHEIEVNFRYYYDTTHFKTADLEAKNVEHNHFASFDAFGATIGGKKIRDYFKEKGLTLQRITVARIEAEGKRWRDHEGKFKQETAHRSFVVTKKNRTFAIQPSQRFYGQTPIQTLMRSRKTAR